MNRRRHTTDPDQARRIEFRDVSADTDEQAATAQRLAAILGPDTDPASLHYLIIDDLPAYLIGRTTSGRDVALYLQHDPKEAGDEPGTME